MRALSNLSSRGRQVASQGESLVAERNMGRGTEPQGGFKRAPNSLTLATEGWRPHLPLNPSGLCSCVGV